jgi:hypothetical protein
MSNAIGGIRFKDGTIRYYQYHGSTDTVISGHYATAQEVLDNWRTYPASECRCGKEEEVEFYSSYADGFYFKGWACKKCGSCRGDGLGMDLDTVDRNDVDEDWWIEPQIRWPINDTPSK